MLQNDAVADFLTSKFNEVAEERNFPRKFLIHDGAYSHDDNSAYINGILTLQSPEVKPIINYFWAKCTYSLEFNLSLSTGFNRIKDLNSIISDVISNINGFQFDLGDGRAIFSVKLPTTTGLEIRKVLGQSVLPKLSIEVEYSSNRDGLRYEMALIDSIFDDGSINTRWFASQTEQQAYYNEKVANGGAPYCELMTPNLNSLTLTQQMYINDLRYYPPGTENVLDTNTILQKNYAIIRAVDKDNVPVSYYYYYVQSADLGPNNQPLFSLKMDTLQTFYFDPEIVFTDSLIKKAHLNRFIDNGDGSVSFNGNADSQLFECEDIPSLPKRLIKRSKLKFNFTGNSLVDEWLNENVAFWVYVYLDKNHEYTIQDPWGAGDIKTWNTTLSYNFPDGGRYSSGCGVVCYPVMKTNKYLLVRKQEADRQGDITINWSGLDNFENSNKPTIWEDDKYVEKDISYAPYFFNIKLSLIPPISSIYADAFLEDGNLVISAETGITDYQGFHIGYATAIATEERTNNKGAGLLTSINQRTGNFESDLYDAEVDFSFLKTEIVGTSRDLKFNPKLKGSKFCDLSIVSSSGESFSYDLQKLNGNSITFLYTEALQPEVTRYYARVKAPQGLYVEDTNNNYLGLVGSTDNAMAFANDAYSQFLANNKNFFLQSNLKIAENTGMAALGGAVAGGGALSAFSAAAGMVTSFIDRELTVDNLKNSPGMLKNANGNVLFNMMVDDLALYVEKNSAIDNELAMADDIMYMNGFTLNRLGNVKDYDNIRKYFNYVQAEIETINGVSLSNNAREDLRQRFRNGVRFWNSDNVQYDLENYENWLEDVN